MTKMLHNAVVTAMPTSASEFLAARLLIPTHASSHMPPTLPARRRPVRPPEISPRINTAYGARRATCSPGQALPTVYTLRAMATIAPIRYSGTAISFQ